MPENPTDLIPEQTPDFEMRLSRGAFHNLIEPTMDGAPIAEFTGIAYKLGVYMLAGNEGCVVAPSDISGPPRAMAETDVRFFNAGSPDSFPASYARASLWALRQVTADVHAETTV